MIIIEDGSGAIEYYYGKMGKVAKTRRTLIVPNQAVATYVTQWKYDSHNRLLEMIYPDEEKVTYGYNLGGQVDHVRGYKSYGYDYVNKIGYDKFEQRTYLKYCNGAETFYSYDPQRRRLQNLAVNAGGKTILDSALQLQSIKDNYKTFDLPYNDQDNTDYVNGKGFSSDDDTPEAAQARAMVKTRAGEAGTNERMQFYYHPDHLGSSSYITNLDGEVSQHIEYVPYGEVFIDELELTRKSATAGKANCNNTWNTPYRFNDCANEGRGKLACSMPSAANRRVKLNDCANEGRGKLACTMPSAANRRVELNAKEFDEETGLYYYGARYYEPRLSLWMSVDPMKEKYNGISSYTYVLNNPVRFNDPDGKDVASAIAETVGTFVVSAGVSFVENLISNGGNVNTAIHQIDWKGASIDAVVAGATSLIFSCASTAKLIKKLAGTKVGRSNLAKIMTSTVENMITNISASVSKGEKSLKDVDLKEELFVALAGSFSDAGLGKLSQKLEKSLSGAKKNLTESTNKYRSVVRSRQSKFYQRYLKGEVRTAQGRANSLQRRVFGADVARSIGSNSAQESTRKLYKRIE